MSKRQRRLDPGSNDHVRRIVLRRAVEHLTSIYDFNGFEQSLLEENLLAALHATLLGMRQECVGTVSLEIAIAGRREAEKNADSLARSSAD